jgi:hypothetical protein
MRTLVLVLGTRFRPYPMLIRASEATWASVAVPDVEVVFYFGGDGPRMADGHLTLPVPDDFAHIGEKTIACFEYLLENREFDLVFRTNCSSYVDLMNLSRYVAAHAQARGFYAGTPSTHGGVTFASGSGYFLSRDLVELVVRERDAWNHALLDDVALGLLLSTAGHTPVAVPRIDYSTPREVVDVDVSQFHFRCKTPSRARLDDVEILLRLHRAFCRARNRPLPRPLLLDWRLARAGRGALRRVRASASRRSRA